MGLYDCSSSDRLDGENAIFAYSSTLMDQQLLFDLSPNNGNATVHSSTRMHCDYINDSILSMGGVKVFFPLLIPEHSLPEEMRLSHTLPGAVGNRNHDFGYHS